jgi:meso-butanediol dehydrogenase/(S,S)-butanediol dehydrogenase/diacetyl reductase
MDLGLANKVAIVTGAARGIGLAIAEALFREGARVILADINYEALSESMKQIGENDARLSVVKTDVTKKADAENLVSVALKDYGGVDILVNNAGVAKDIMFVDIEEEDWNLVFDVNVKGVYMVTRAVVPHMMKAEYGKIINMSSRSGKEGQVGLCHYGASKFAVIGLTQALAKELGPYNVNVNAVCPGILRTSMWEVLIDSRCKRQGIPREEMFKNWVAQIPLGRPQESQDVANAVLFLASDVSRNVTGEAINVNGGMRMD